MATLGAGGAARSAAICYSGGELRRPRRDLDGNEVAGYLLGALTNGSAPFEMAAAI